MEFAILFILAFIVGLVVYLLSNQWMIAVGASIGLFLISILTDSDAQSSWTFSLIFGVPIVFVGSLLGPYVVELRRGEVFNEAEADGSHDQNSNNENSSNEKKD